MSEEKEAVIAVLLEENEAKQAANELAFIAGEIDEEEYHFCMMCLYAEKREIIIYSMQ